MASTIRQTSATTAGMSIGGKAGGVLSMVIVSPCAGSRPRASEISFFTLVSWSLVTFLPTTTQTSMLETPRRTCFLAASAALAAVLSLVIEAAAGTPGSISSSFASHLRTTSPSASAFLTWTFTLATTATSLVLR